MEDPSEENIKMSAITEGEKKETIISSEEEPAVKCLRSTSPDNAADTPASCNPNLSSDEDDIELIEKTRGDAVGDTLYSQRFILKTIVELSKLENNLQENEQLETDLCSLWDMTIEPAVVNFLLHEDALDLFAHVIDNTEDFRLIELLVGMLANMCFNERGFKELTQNADAIEILLKLTSCMDTLILVQLMRLLETVMTHLGKTVNAEMAKKWYEYFSVFEDFAERFGFILKMCIDENLLRSCLKTLNSILVVCALVAERDAELTTNEETKLANFDEVFVHKDLIDGTYNAFMQLMSHADTNEKEENEEYALGSDAANEVIQVYLNIHTMLAQNERSIDCYEPYKQPIMNSLTLILIPMCDPLQLLPMNEQYDSYVDDIKHICQCLHYPFHVDLFSKLYKIWSLIDEHITKLKTQEHTTSEFERDDNDFTVENYISLQFTLLSMLANILEQADASDLQLALKNVTNKGGQALLDALNVEVNKIDYSVAKTNLQTALRILQGE